MGTDRLRRKLMPHIPEAIATDWVRSAILPEGSWDEGLPSVGLGLKLIQGLDEDGISMIVRHFRNPDLLDAIAKQDHPFSVARALVSTRLLSKGGLIAIREQHGAALDGWLLLGRTDIRFADLSQIGVPLESLADGAVLSLIQNEARASGPLEAVRYATACGHFPAINAFFERIFRDVEIGGGIEHDAAEVVSALEYHYEHHRWDYHDMFVPRELFELKDVPEAAERLLKAAMRCPAKLDPHPAHDLCRLLPERPSGDLFEDVERIQLDDQDLRMVVEEWTRRKPIAVDQIDIVRSLLAKGSAVYGDHEAVLVGMQTGFAVQTTDLVGAILHAWSATSDMDPDKRLRLLNRLIDRSPGPFSQADQSRLDAVLAEAVGNASVDVVEELFVTRTLYRPWSSRLAEASGGCITLRRVLRRRIAEKVTAGGRLPTAENKAAWLIDDVVQELVQQIADGRLSEDEYAHASTALLVASSMGRIADPILNLIEADFDRLFRHHIPGLENNSDVLYQVLEEHQAGDSTKLDVILDLLKQYGTYERRGELGPRSALAATARGLRSGAFHVEQIKLVPGAVRAVAEVFTEEFGEDVARWSLAIEMLDWWDGTLPGLLEVLQASQ